MLRGKLLHLHQVFLRDGQVCRIGPLRARDDGRDAKSANADEVSFVVCAAI